MAGTLYYAVYSSLSPSPSTADDISNTGSTWHTNYGMYSGSETSPTVDGVYTYLANPAIADGSYRVAFVWIDGAFESNISLSGVIDVIAGETAEPSYNNLVSALAPLRWFKTDETSGTTAVDSSTNAIDGTYYNTPTLNQTGLLNDGTAIDLDGGLYQWLLAGNDIFTLTNDFTIEAWFECPARIADGSSHWNTIAADLNTDGRGSFSLRVREMATHEMKLWLETECATTKASYEGENDHIVPGKIYHVVAIWDATAKTWDMYVNGEQHTTWENTQAGVGAPTEISPREFNIGRIRTGGSATQYYDGKMDNIVVYDKKLTQQNIGALYNAGVILYYQNAVVANNPTHYWPLHAIANTAITSSFSYTEDFSVAPNGRPNEDFWDIGYYPAVVSAGDATITADDADRTNRGGMLFRYALKGNFDVELNWTLDQGGTWGAGGNTDRFYLYSFDLNTAVDTRRYIYREDSLERVASTDGTTYNYYTWSVFSGYFRIVRDAGTDVRLYHKQNLGDSWTHIGTYADYAIDAEIGIRVQTSGEHTATVHSVNITADQAIMYFSQFPDKINFVPGITLDHIPQAQLTQDGPYAGRASAIYFDGVDNYMQAWQLVGPQGATFSAELWFKTSAALTSGNPMALISWGDDGTAGEYICLHLLTSSEGTAGALEVEVEGGGRSTGANTFNDNTWHHVVILGGATAADLQIWVDGVREDNTTTGTGSTTVNVSSDRPVSLAVRYGTATNEWYEGYLSDVALYTTVLSQSNIEDHFNAVY